MAQISNTGRRSLARFVAGVMFAATIAVASFAGTASAADHRDWHGDRQWHHGWGGGYYEAPPVVYGQPYYAPPPVVVGPGFGLNINIR
jgi:hypothetical protein